MKNEVISFWSRKGMCSVQVRSHWMCVSGGSTPCTRTRPCSSEQGVCSACALPEWLTREAPSPQPLASSAELRKRPERSLKTKIFTGVADQSEMLWKWVRFGGPGLTHQTLLVTINPIWIFSPVLPGKWQFPQWQEGNQGTVTKNGECCEVPG